MALLKDFMPLDLLEEYIKKGYITRQVHPTLPLTILNYTHKTQRERFWNDVTKRCRGFIYHSVTQEVIARPFPKFFNLNEEGGFTSEQLRKYVGGRNKIRIKEKMDGSLGICYKVSHDGTVHHGVATRGSFTSPQAVFATKYLNDLIKKTGSTWVYNRQTPLVEIIYPENRIVIDYGKFAGLVALAITNTISFAEDYSYQHVRTWAKQLGIPVAITYAGKDAFNLAEEIRPNCEGYVLEVDADYHGVLRAKVKLKEYCRLHKVITGWNAKSVWELLKEGHSYEELFDASLPEHFRKWFSTVVDSLKQRYEAVEKQAKSEFLFAKECVLRSNENRRILRKAYAEEFTKNEKFKGIFFNLLDNKNYSDIIWDMVRPKADETFILDVDVATEGAE